MADLYDLFSELDIKEGSKLVENRNVSAQRNGNYVMGRVYDHGMHNVVLELKNNKIESMVCTCVEARNGSCRHEAALVIYLQKTGIIKFNEESYADIDLLFQHYLNRLNTISDKDYSAFQDDLLKKLDQIHKEADKDLAAKKIIYVCKQLEKLFDTKESIRSLVISSLNVCIIYLGIYRNKEISNKINRLLKTKDNEGNEIICIIYARYFIYSTEGFKKDKLLETTVKAIQNSEDDIINKYMVTNLNLDLKREKASLDTKIKTMEQCVNSCEAYKYLVEYYSENNDIENEKEALMKLLSIQEMELEIWIDYRDDLLDLIKQTKDKDRYLKYLTIMFSRDSYISNNYFIKTLKNYYKEDEWEKDKKIVFETIKKDCPVEKYCDALYAAKEYKELLSTIIENKDIFLFNQYKTALMNFSEETSVMLYLYFIEDSLKNIKNKKDYVYIIKSICNDLSSKDNILVELCLYLTSTYPENEIIQSFVRDLKEKMMKDRKETTNYEDDKLPF